MFIYFFSCTVLSQERTETNVLLDGIELSPFQNKGIAYANFQSFRNIFCENDLLKGKHMIREVQFPFSLLSELYY